MQPLSRVGSSSDNLSELVYQRIKNDIFDFKLMPGERFTESEIAQTYEVSRTPTRQALYRLQQEGYVEVAFRSGWTVRPLNLKYYDELYEMRIMIEQFAIQKMSLLPCHEIEEIQNLMRIWKVDAVNYVQDLKTMAHIDEDFHCAIVRAAGNHEMANLHQEISEKIRIIRRLDFSKSNRIEATYIEHQQILNAILQQQTHAALSMISTHIQQSRDEVKKITLAMLNPMQILSSIK
ncbi:MAG: GntR family transcriptional regulator [Candidatus Acinetobacter avistercoris]|uniref:GntR family transcriptional regulator n=1 Tax=Acinetobacter sp. KS-LM10 TaxID=3120518 RepID=UPI001F94C382|nr:GntR family transcriptional regulator [Candidatus Acinetobacter avistercoris]